MMPAVLLDANVYRSLGSARFETMVTLERERGVTRYGEPFALTELLVHLADPQDEDFAPCRAAVIRMFRRCEGDGPCGMIRDSESRLAELITGKGLAKHEAHTNQLLILFDRVARVACDQPLAEGENIRLRQLAAPEIRNLLWDQRFTFNAGQNIGGRTLWLVTDDRDVAKAAKAAGHERVVYKLAAYEQWLRAA